MDMRERTFKRSMLRSSFQSLFWSVLLNRKRKNGLTITELASTLGVDKSYVSRSFGSPPNWQIDKIADFADALGVEISIVARDMKTGELFTPTGVVNFASAVTEIHSTENVASCKSSDHVITDSINISLSAA